MSFPPASPHLPHRCGDVRRCQYQLTNEKGRENPFPRPLPLLSRPSLHIRGQLLGQSEEEMSFLRLFERVGDLGELLETADFLSDLVDLRQDLLQLVRSSRGDGRPALR